MISLETGSSSTTRTRDLSSMIYLSWVLVQKNTHSALQVVEKLLRFADAALKFGSKCPITSCKRRFFRLILTCLTHARDVFQQPAKYALAIQHLIKQLWCHWMLGS
jgi:hypothetical protein